MKLITVNLPIEVRDIEIVPISDCHIGSKKCDYNLLKEQISYIANHENAYTIVLGDIINNSTKGSKGDVYAEELSPRESVQKAIELFKPIADKVLGICSGNHERRTSRESGDDLVEHIAFGLGQQVFDRYDYTAGLIFLSFGKATRVYQNQMRSKCRNNQAIISIYFTHGDGTGGRLIGGKANGLERRGQIVDADIIIMGHTHQPLSFSQVSYRVDKNRKICVRHEQLFVNTSATLDYEEYAEQYGMRPSSKRCPKILLSDHDVPKVIF